MEPAGLVLPLVRRSTWQRGVYLLLGAVVLLPYLLTGVLVVQMVRSASPLLLTALVTTVLLVVAVVPPFLAGTRALEIAAARFLLDADLPEPVVGRPTWEARVRAAVWFALHLAAGGVVATLLLTAVPMALALVLHDVDPPTRLATLGVAVAPWLWSTLGLVLLAVSGYAVAGLGSLAALMAPVLLGPSAAERVAAVQADARRLAERHRLARDLHDSIGHALTVTTLQAAAAQEVFDSDPAFARRALAAVERVGRTATEELDFVLGILRDGGSDVPGRALQDVSHLCADARAAGVVVDLAVVGDLAVVPATVSREGYRIVQESLSNAVRHAGGVGVRVHLRVAADELHLQVDNPVPAGAGGDRAARGADTGGRGLAGVRERVSLLRGDAAVGPADGGWRVTVRLPFSPRLPG